jgi:hypothetical protein
MKDIFDPTVISELKSRVGRLNESSQQLWGKMNAAQMIAHVNVAYELDDTSKYPPVGAVKKFFMKLFLKPIVVSEKPYKPNSPTAPEFKVSDKQVFEQQKSNLFKHLDEVSGLGRSHFEGKEARSFGPLTAQEWNNMLYKHIDHHLNQFGV